MENEIIEQPQVMELTLKDMIGRREKILSVMKSIMRQNIDYGTVPGCKKPSLYKPGSEKLLSTFMLTSNPEVEDISTSDERRFRVKVQITHSSTGIFLGSGIGECSTSEEKYHWRGTVCPAEYDATDPERRREKYKRDGSVIKQVRTTPADLANTVLKIAKKRAQIDATLTVTAASDIFTQDVEDMPAEYLNQGQSAQPKQSMPARKSQGDGEKKQATGIIGKHFLPKGKSSYHSFTVEGYDNMYFQSSDKVTIENLIEHGKIKDTVTLDYTETQNGQFTNRLITEVSVQQGDAQEPNEEPER